MTKYKYYFRRPRSVLIKDVLLWVAKSGIIYIAASSPYFVINLLKAYPRWRKYKKTNLSNTFYRLRKAGCIRFQKRNHQIYISLTAEGKEKAGWLQIDALKIKRPRKWDRKWRIVIFDIAQLKKIYRELFRGKLKELGFVPLQKSVWIHPFDCRDEIELLKDFFALIDKEVRLIVAQDIGDDDFLREIFKI